MLEIILISLIALWVYDRWFKRPEEQSEEGRSPQGSELTGERSELEGRID